ncbi:hypothetical protein GCM10009765_49860 [Fodinicola feengrottensis]|uniref:Uncharacterized protein n=1 Tax=Fodinicola feengrottensis TaxID=435914 RepID=A0ABP4TVE7_9ACTN
MRLFSAKFLEFAMATDLLDDVTTHRGYRGRHRRTGALTAAVLGVFATLVSARRSSEIA